MTNIINFQRLLSGRASHRSSGMTWKRILVVTAMLVAMSLFAAAQTDDTPESEGKALGVYNVHQSIEFGGRMTSGFGGNLSMYNSLVNLQSGPRLLDQSLTMHSENHVGLFFDDLTESAMGLGGDPNQIVRMRMAKSKMYEFSVQYRHDQYYSDYNLLGNSLAVPVANPLGVNIFDVSPHFMGTRRAMTDFDLRLLPQSRVSFRLGYSHGRDQGPALTSIHSPGNVFYLENFDTRSDRYKLGMDVKPFARTIVSYDFLFEHDRNDTAALNDANLNYLLGTTGVSIDPDFSFDPNAKIPSCTFTTNSDGQVVANSTCAGFIAYNRTQAVKTDLPTHVVSLVSNYFRKLDLAASASYTTGTAKVADYNEYYARFSNPTFSQNGYTGNMANRQVTGSADFKATIHFNNSWSFDEIFRWVNWRTPEFGSLTNAMTTNVTAGTVLTPGTLPSATSLSLYSNFLGENSKYNTLQLNWNPTRKFGARVGYKIGVRTIKDASVTNTYTIATSTLAAGTPSADKEDETEHHALIGFTARPIDRLRLSADGDLMYSDSAYTLISPRHAQTVRVKSSYNLAQWATISGAVGFNNRRNDGGALFPAAVASEQYKSHVNSYDLSFELHPARKADIEVGWSYEDILENSPQCIPLNLGSAATSYGFGTNYCLYSTGAARSGSGGTYPLFSNYAEKTNTGYIVMVLKPAKRVTLNVGYDITSNTGSQYWFRADNGQLFNAPVDALGNPVDSTTQVAVGTAPGLYPWNPEGNLSYNWHRPVLGVSIAMAKGLTFKGGFNNYDYNEKGAAQQMNPVLPRDFHGNTFTLSLKHSF